MRAAFCKLFSDQFVAVCREHERRALKFLSSPRKEISSPDRVGFWSYFKEIFALSLGTIFDLLSFEASVFQLLCNREKLNSESGKQQTIAIGIENGRQQIIAVDSGRQQIIAVDSGRQQIIAVDSGRQQIIVVDSGRQQIIVVDSGRQQIIVVDSGRQQIIAVDSVDSGRQQIIVVDSGRQQIIAVDSGRQQIIAVDSGRQQIIAVDSGRQQIIVVDSESGRRAASVATQCASTMRQPITSIGGPDICRYAARVHDIMITMSNAVIEICSPDLYLLS
ncbi:hypothetical protein CEXT_346461 [Caerostris extrusa]|uniref:Uncharacterized protein n=1 Tax=Caerostris extrusa TaxID=172846 RepID=A0AAV4R112_CAEEX|nr:hypothetical protein CEXT_346461 [Caerostris extrusa]